MNFWVCEKSDGVRVLVFVVMNGGTGEQEVWLVSLSVGSGGSVERVREGETSWVHCIPWVMSGGG